MGWIGPGAHEGWAAAVASDGSTASTHTAGGVIVSRAPDGSDLPFSMEHGPANPNWRPDGAIVGWVGECECGWRGEQWTRVWSPEQADPQQRLIYSDDAYLDEPTDAGIHAEWQAHVAPLAAIEVVEDAAARARETAEALDESVRAARAAGASWLYIGRATGMTRQSAHERWRRFDPPTAEEAAALRRLGAH